MGGGGTVEAGFSSKDPTKTKKKKKKTTNPPMDTAPPHPPQQKTANVPHPRPAAERTTDKAPTHQHPLTPPRAEKPKTQKTIRLRKKSPFKGLLNRQLILLP